MRHLLDVNVVISAIVQTHSTHEKARQWLQGKEIALCPLVELGFVRIATNPKTSIGMTMERARRFLRDFKTERKATWIPDDLETLDSHPKNFSQVTDHYLADLAAKHGLKLATFDESLKHPVVELVC